MSIAQIAAIIGLLVAFGVDQPTVNNVQAILESPSHTSAIGAPAGATIESMETATDKQLKALRDRIEELHTNISSLEQARKEELKSATNSTQRNTVYSTYARQINPLAEELKALQTQEQDLQSSK